MKILIFFLARGTNAIIGLTHSIPPYIPSWKNSMKLYHKGMAPATTGTCELVLNWNPVGGKAVFDRFLSCDYYVYLHICGGPSFVPPTKDGLLEVKLISKPVLALCCFL